MKLSTLWVSGSVLGVAFADSSAYARNGLATATTTSTTGAVLDSVHSGGDPCGVCIVANEQPPTITASTTALITAHRIANHSQ